MKWLIIALLFVNDTYVLSISERGRWHKEQTRLMKESLDRLNRSFEKTATESVWARREMLRVVHKYPQLRPIAVRDQPAFQEILKDIKARGKRVEDYMGEEEEPRSPVNKDLPAANSISPELLRMINKEKSLGV